MTHYHPSTTEKLDRLLRLGVNPRRLTKDRNEAFRLATEAARGTGHLAIIVEIPDVKVYDNAPKRVQVMSRDVRYI